MSSSLFGQEKKVKQGDCTWLDGKVGVKVTWHKKIVHFPVKQQARKNVLSFAPKRWDELDELIEIYVVVVNQVVVRF